MSTSTAREDVGTRAVLARALVVAGEIVLGVGALYGGIGLMTRSVGMPDSWLRPG